MAPSPSSSTSLPSLLFTAAGVITGAALASIYYKTKAKTQQENNILPTREEPPTNKDRSQIIQNIGEYLCNTTNSANNNKVCVLGGGAFGTSLAYAAARNGYTVSIYCRDEAQAASINSSHINPRYLSDTILPSSITATTELKGAVLGCMLIILALPCQKTPDFLRENRSILPGGVVMCVTAKGLYLPTRQLISDAIEDALNNTNHDGGGEGQQQQKRKPNPLAFFSGPTFASEIVKDNPTVAVVASQTLYHAVHVQKILSNETNFRLYVSQDIVSVQLGGALKNPLAVGAGLLTGCGYGINTLSAYVTRATGELRQLCVALGGEADTINGLSGVGDLMLTCFSTQSRNQRCGVRLAHGESIEDILKDGMTVEGVATATVAVLYADACGLDMPLFRAVAGVIEGKLNCEEALKRLFERPLGLEMKKK